MYTYKIFHEYQIGDQSVLFKSPIAPNAMEDLLASLQFHFEEYIDEDESLCERAATEIINVLYAPVEYITGPAFPHVVNTHYNREMRCGDAYNLLKTFDKSGLIELMKDEQAKEEARLKREIPELREAE